MKRKFLTTAVLLGCFTIALAMVSGVTGKWTGELPMGNNYRLNYMLNVDNGKLTGFEQSADGTADLTDGKIYGDSISFVTDAMGSKMMHTGKYFAAGDSIGLDITFGGQKFHGAFRRADSK
jgi:hypothetical protein